MTKQDTDDEKGSGNPITDDYTRACFEGRTNYVGLMCPKHPKLEGRRRTKSRACVGCERDRNRKRRKTEAHREWERTYRRKLRADKKKAIPINHELHLIEAIDGLIDRDGLHRAVSYLNSIIAQRMSASPVRLVSSAEDPDKGARLLNEAKREVERSR